MKIRKVLVTGTAVLVMGGLVAGGAFAANAKSTNGKSATSSDTDNIQQGDQTAPDTSTSSDGASKVSTLTKSPKSEAESAGDTDNIQQGDQAGQEDSASEPSSESDGPGSHRDFGTNVNHESSGQE